MTINECMYGRSPYIDYMLYLFKVTSEEMFPDRIEIPNDAWIPYISILYNAAGQELPEMVITDCLPVIDVEKSNKVLLAFSGGKDSVAHAAFLKDNESTDPILFFVKNVNRSYPNEYNVSVKIAEMLDIPLVEDYVKFSGKVFRAESPVKNHLILSMMIDYMSRNGINKCACGTYLEDTLAKTSAFFGLSDAYEFYLTFEKAIQRTFPNFRWICWFRSEVHALGYLVNTHKELIPEYQSCILPDRYRKNIRARNEAKFGIELLPNRCMSCWKCCQEYLILHLFRYHSIPMELIHNRIYAQFRKDLKKVMSEDRLPDDVDGMPLRDLIDCYVTLSDVQRYTVMDNILEDIDMGVFV